MRALGEICSASNIRLRTEIRAVSCWRLAQAKARLILIPFGRVADFPGDQDGAGEHDHTDAKPERHDSEGRRNSTHTQKGLTELNLQAGRSHD